MQSNTKYLLLTEFLQGSMCSKLPETSSLIITLMFWWQRLL